MDTDIKIVNVVMEEAGWSITGKRKLVDLVVVAHKKHVFIAAEKAKCMSNYLISRTATILFS